MCFLSLAKKINMFERDSSRLTRADVLLTYMCILCSTGIIAAYSVKYFELARTHIDACEKTQSAQSCTRSEIIHIVVPYVGVLYGFLVTLYKSCNLLALFVNYICCCYTCCKSTNPNQTPVEIELRTNHTPIV